MGANLSSAKRPVVAENKNPAPGGVIQLSDDVVQRLKNQHIQGLAAKRASADGEQQQQNSAAATVAGDTSGTTFAGQPTITAIEVRRQKDAELRANDLYWTKRLASQEQAQRKTNSIQEKEFNTALDNVRSRFENAPPQHQTPPCGDIKSRLIQCYRSNPGATLLCSQHVDAFTHCVNSHRTQLLDAKHKAAEATANVPPSTTTGVKAH